MKLLLAGLEWIQNLNAQNGTQVWSLSRQDKPELQSVLIDQASTPEKPAYVLVIRTWDQISVDQDAARQDQLDKMEIPCKANRTATTGVKNISSKLKIMMFPSGCSTTSSPA
jgi:hypothetical protein